VIKLARAGTALAICAVLGLFWFHEDRLHFTDSVKFSLIGPYRHPTTLIAIPTGELQETLHREYTIVTKVQNIPPIARDAFVKWGEASFDMGDLATPRFEMADPGSPILRDFWTNRPEPPLYRLKFAALGEESSIILYEVGGPRISNRVLVVDYARKYIWGAELKDDVTDMESLSKTVTQGRFRAEKPWLSTW
jgi:hypothetical protein